MENIIYLACMQLNKINGDYDLDPCIAPDSKSAPKMLANTDLVALQLENNEYLSCVKSMGSLIIVPISIEKYNEMESELNSLMSNIETSVQAAVEKMTEAYRLMNISVDADEMKKAMLEEATNCGSFGKVLNSNLEIVERAVSYVVEDDEDDYDYDDDYEDDEDYEDDDDYYDEED